MRFQVLMICLLISGCQQSQEALQSLIQRDPTPDVADLPLASTPAGDGPSHARSRARAILLKTNPPATISASERRFLRDAGMHCHDPYVRQRLAKEIRADGGAFAGGGPVPFQGDVLDAAHEAQRLQAQAHADKRDHE